MPVTTDWYDDTKTIVLTKIVGHWRIDEVVIETQTAQKRLNYDVYCPRYFIIDLCQSDSIPSGVLSYRNVFNAYIYKDSMTIIVGAHDILQLFINTMQKIGLNGTTFCVDTLQDALKIISNDFMSSDALNA